MTKILVVGLAVAAVCGCQQQSSHEEATVKLVTLDTAHFHASAHPLIQSFEPGEDWYYCYLDDLMFLEDGDVGSPSHS